MNQTHEKENSGELFDESFWKKPTKKVVFKWLKHYLPANCKLSLKSLANSFASGDILVELIRSLSNQRFSLPKKKAKSVDDKVSNLQLAIDFCKDRGIPLEIVPEDIIKQNEKKILVMIWKIALSFSFRNAFLFQVDHNSYLLEWCQLVTESYNFKITDFENSFRDGRAFCMLVDFHHSGIISRPTLNQKKAIKNLQKAFELLDLLNVPDLLDPKEVASGKIGKYGIFLYIAELYKKFSHPKKKKKTTQNEGDKKNENKGNTPNNVIKKEKEKKNKKVKERKNKKVKENKNKKVKEKKNKKGKKKGKKKKRNNKGNEQVSSMNKIIKLNEEKILKVFVKLREAQSETQKYKEIIERLQKDKNQEESGEESDPDDPLIKIPKHLRDQKRKQLLILCERQNNVLKKKLKDQEEDFEIQLQEKINKITFLTNELEKSKLPSEKETQLEEQLNENEEKIFNLKRKKKNLKEKFVKQEKENKNLQCQLENQGACLERMNTEKMVVLNIQNQESISELIKEKDRKIEKITNDFEESQSLLSESVEINTILKQKNLKLQKSIQNKENELKKEFDLQKKEYEQNEKTFQKQQVYFEKVIHSQALELEKLRGKKSSINNDNDNILNNQLNNNNSQNRKNTVNDYLQLKNAYTTLEIENQKLLDQYEDLNKNQKEREEKLQECQDFLKINKKNNFEENVKLKKELSNSKKKFELFLSKVNRDKTVKNSEIRKIGKALMEKKRENQTLKDSLLQLSETNNESLQRSKKRIKEMTHEIKDLNDKLNISNNRKIILRGTLEDLELKFQKEYEEIINVIETFNANCKDHKKLKKWKGLPNMLKFFDLTSINYEYKRQQSSLRQRQNDYNNLSRILNQKIEDISNLKKQIIIHNETEEKMSIELNSLRRQIKKLQDENIQTNALKLSPPLPNSNDYILIDNSPLNKNPNNGMDNQSSFQKLKTQQLKQIILSKDEKIEKLSNLVEKNEILERIQTQYSFDLDTDITIKKLTQELVDSKMVIQELKKSANHLPKSQSTNSNLEKLTEYEKNRDAIMFELDKIDSMVF
ncbi:alpha-actinin-3 [Anaeramoeba flamelloides]|uniref:Alpha-actinin-3 n=1 Tax=Anaeramoeba flamelloides TaxID=1746091 RepID=A0ABQ8Y422_9EUKA|nr:alpha-actinin-3 [Anaeramoeba flamelloides]